MRTSEGYVVLFAGDVERICALLRGETLDPAARRLLVESLYRPMWWSVAAFDADEHTAGTKAANGVCSSRGCDMTAYVSVRRHGEPRTCRALCLLHAFEWIVDLAPHLDIVRSSFR